MKSKSESRSVVSSSLDPMDYTVHGIVQARIVECVAFPFSRESSQPRDQTQVSHIACDSLPAEPQWTPKNIGVGGIFLTQESNRSLLHGRQILYQLNYQESPNYVYIYTLFFFFFPGELVVKTLLSQHWSAD